MSKKKKKYSQRTSIVIAGKRYDIKARNKKELRDKIERKKADIKNRINPCTYTVTQWTAICIDTYKTGVTDATLTGYRSKCRRWIDPVIGKEKITDVTPLQCQDVLNRMTGKSQDTIKKVRELLYFIFDKALLNRYISENPAQNLTLPAGDKKTRRPITEKERAAILSVADSDPKYTYFLFMLLCGCRPSEAAGIQGKDIQGELLHIRGTKTENSDRFVPIPEYLKNRIPKVDPDTHLTVNARGGKLSATNREILWKHFKRDLNIFMGCKVYRNELIPPYPVAPDLTPYCLRHTYCTDLMRAGVDLRTAQRLMGHASIRMTAEVYTHVDTSAILDAGDKIGKYTDNKASSLEVKKYEKTQKIGKNSEKNSETNPQPVAITSNHVALSRPNHGFDSRRRYQ